MGVERIVVDPNILVGKPVVKGARLAVDYSVIPKLPPPRTRRALKRPATRGGSPLKQADEPLYQF